MKNVLKSLSDPMKSSAKVVDGKLILSFPGALRPVVWQMDFSHVKASALEVQEKEEHFVLSLKTPKGETVEVAPFETKKEAVDGLLEASKALESAQGQIRPVASNDTESAPATAPAPSKKRTQKWLAPLLGVIMLFILLTVWASLSAPLPNTNATSTASNASTGAVGVPLSADDFLRAQ